MVTSWTEQAKQFKSSLSVVAGFLLRSRETQAERAKSRTKEIQRLKQVVEQLQGTICKLEEQIAEKDAEMARRKIENQNCASSKFINEQGVFPGAARQLRDYLRTVRNDPESKSTAASRQVIACLLRFLRPSEAKLTEGQRLPMSTEILESSFGLFKQLERQHSKGGFTSLLAAYGCLLHPTTPEKIRRDFAQISVKDMQHWVSEKLGKTLASKRQTAYQEYHNAS